MADLRLQVSIPVVGGAPQDAAINTWSFSATDPPTTDIPAITTAIQAFYNSVKAFASRHLDFTIVHAKWYDHNQPPPRPPVVDAVWNLGAGSATPVSLPHDVAICVSFQGERIAGIRQARRRGRLYIGPLSTDCLTDGRVSSTVQTNLKNAAAAVLTASNASPAWAWVVSGASGPAVVSNGWVDNEFDTQRRRGLVATVRTVFP